MEITSKLHPKVCRHGRLKLPLLLHMTCTVKRENVSTSDNIVLLKLHDSKEYYIIVFIHIPCILH